VIGFGYNIGWLALRSRDPTRVASSIQLARPSPAPWNAGIEAAYGAFNRAVFVTPSVDEWTFVVGQPVAGNGTGATIAQLQHLIARLSYEFVEAQAFATHHVVEYHHWMLARGGELRRCFAYLGESDETLANLGVPTAPEIQMGWFDETGSAADWFPSEQDVLTIAGAWGIDPSRLDNAPVPVGLGMLGLFEPA
jgi:hypothetical protein